MAETAPTPTTDQARRDFAGTMLGILNGSALGLMVSIGHRTGLFDVLAGLPPSTSDEIAVAASLNERYVREWLAALVVGRIVEFDPSARRYSLPPAHAASLTRVSGPANLATMLQYVAVLGSVEDDLVRAFRDGGGVPYGRYRRFHEVLTEDTNQRVVPFLFRRVLPLVPDLVDRLARGIDVLDLGCGSGRVVALMATEFPNSRFTGFDCSTEAIESAQAQASKLSNARFEVRDASSLGITEAFDLVMTFDAIHDQRDPLLVLRQLYEALRPGGWHLMEEIPGSSSLEKNLDGPISPLLYTMSCMHCMPVSLADGGAGLGTMWGQEMALEYLQEAGFPSTTVTRVVNNYFVSQRPA